MSGQVRSDRRSFRLGHNSSIQLKVAKDKSGQVRSGNVRSAQAKSNYVRSRQSQVSSCQLKLGIFMSKSEQI